MGFLLPTTLPAIQSILENKDMAVITATWAFLRSFDGVWGISIHSAAFNSKVNNVRDRVDDPQLRSQLRNEGAYAMAGRDFMQSLTSGRISSVRS